MRRAYSSIYAEKGRLGKCELAAGQLVTKEMEKDEVLSAFFATAFTGKICLQESQNPDT